MRIPSRIQLALLILLSSLVSLGVISIATWVSNHEFVLHIVAQRLALTASLKAGQLYSNLNLMQTTANLVSTRIIVQDAMQRYNYEARYSPRTGQGLADLPPLLNATNVAAEGQIKLPYGCPNGSVATLGLNASECGGTLFGFPPALYPNFTYRTTTYNGVEIQQAEYEGNVLGPQAHFGMVLGPLAINSSFALVSFTVPIFNNTNPLDTLGFLTVIMEGSLIQYILDSTEGLGHTGETLIVRPVNNTNMFRDGILYTSNHGNNSGDFLVEYVLPLNASEASRHPNQTFGTSNPPFLASKYPALQQAITQKSGQEDNAGALIRGHNEAGKDVAVGYAMPMSTVVNWVVLVEQARSEVWKPINRLRDILLACLFATAALMVIIAFPLAHFAVLPIRRLRAATMKSIEPPGVEASRSSFDSFESSRHRTADTEENMESANGTTLARKEGLLRNPVKDWRQKRKQDRELRREQRRKQAFRIPGKVKEHKHLVKDELSDLTKTFNEMSDELMMQYTKLEERVQRRTAELEQSKKAAEAANESKTLFIANISHELKTPLNGILGMCAVCMQEDDPIRLKRSLGIIYKSGDLLLNLLTDLLTFSKNQVGQQLNFDEKEFRLRDISSQVLAIFEKQARDGAIDLRVEWEGVQNIPSVDSSPERPAQGPHGTGRIKDMILWGDIQRILQVLINLVSNSLKFTPSGGSVVLTIRCLPEVSDVLSRKESFGSRQSRQSRAQSSRQRGSDPTHSSSKVNIETANVINAKERPNALIHTASTSYGQDRAGSPTPGKYLSFEFEVTDTGPGIPESLHQRIFEPFVQGDLGLSKKYGGTGLGLSICSQLATLMGGKIGVRSTPGQGSMFTMQIPLRYIKNRTDSSASSTVELPQDNGLLVGSSLEDVDRVPARHSRLAAEEGAEDKAISLSPGGANTPTITSESQPRLVGLSHPFFASSQPMESPGSQPAAMEKMAAEATRSGHKIRVLVAEDNQVNQEVVLRMLKLEDIYDVTVAKDGQEALDFVKESMAPGVAGEERKPFNLIFMDVQMPNVDGLQSTRLIREIGYQAPIVALTAFAEESNIKDCLDSGMNYFLSKPIRRPQLKRVLKEYCAPIPEEIEDPSPSEDPPKSEGQKATIVVVNGANADTQPQSLLNGLPREEQKPPLDSASADKNIRRSESPVSPTTKA